MKTSSEKTDSTTSTTATQAKGQPFFNKSGEGIFFETSNSIQTTNDKIVQRQGPYKQPELQKKSLEDIRFEALRKTFTETYEKDKILDPLVRELSKSYFNQFVGIEFPGKVYYDTPYGWRVETKSIKYSGPTEQRIFNALKPKIKLKKIGKGNDLKDWAWEWRNVSSTRKKTTDEKVQEIGIGLANEYIENKFEKDFINPVKKPILDYAVNWLAKREIVITASFLTGAGEVIAVGMLIYAIADLLLSLDDPIEKELSPYQQESANIVAGVKSFLQQKQEKADLQKNLLQPNQPYTMKSDRLEKKETNYYPGVGSIHK